MAEIPQAAVDAAVAAYAREGYRDGQPINGDERVIRAALEAAAPILAETWGAMEMEPMPARPVCPKCGTSGCLEDKALDLDGL